MKCPHCGKSIQKDVATAEPGARGQTVIESRHRPKDNSIRRRRVCLQCGERFSTVEKVVARRGMALVAADESVAEQVTYGG